MASRKKQSEGIALLSMYNDEEEDEDEDMEDAEEDGRDPPREDGEPRSLEDASMADSERIVSGDDENTPRDDGESTAATPGVAQLRPPTPLQSQAAMSSEIARSGRGKLGIVDYGHDEEGELERSDRAMFGTDLQLANADFHDKTPPGTVQVLTHSNQATPQLSGQSHSDKVNYAADNSEIEDAAGGIEEKEKDIDPLDKFLSPPPKTKCSEELQRKINKFLDYKKVGKSFNAEVRNRKDYRNPDFLLHAVSYQDIDQVGSCFSKDVFDPHGYDKGDYYDEIVDGGNHIVNKNCNKADMRREMERKEQERKKSPKVEFQSAGTQLGIVLGATKSSLPVPGVPSGASVGLHSALPSADPLPRDGRQNKKSKWDKVDGDRRNPLPSGIQDPALAVGAQTTSLSGGGYMAFVQQRRREAEEKRSSDKKLERRT